MTKLRVCISVILLVNLLHSCSVFESPEIPEDQTLDGPVADLTTAEALEFLAGDKAFNDEVFTRETGLGPIFVTTSCGSCHAADGKGHPFSTLIRFGQDKPGTNNFLHLGGPQLQNRALPGYLPEQLPRGASFTKLTPPAVAGLGFLELVSDEDILNMSDPMDLDGDGISGIPNYMLIPNYEKPSAHAIPKGQFYIHRFGKKASAYSLFHQTVNAYNQDIGITSTYNPQDVYSGKQTDPEIRNSAIHAVVFYLQTLKAPVPRNQDNPSVIKGKSLFLQIGCESCHKQTLKTTSSSVEALSNKTFHPYTDLLLHDMGPGLDDGYTEGSAETYEWRTAPLWGLGLSPKSQGGRYFLLHDGRATSIDEAIRLHGGEAEKSRKAYEDLSSDDKKALIKFLESL
jgi:CxxC motif-containing protein (DUF1111 family)